jgi:hypothetical protein
MSPINEPKISSQASSIDNKGGKDNNVVVFFRFSQCLIGISLVCCQKSTVEVEIIMLFLRGLSRIALFYSASQSEALKWGFF